MQTKVKKKKSYTSRPWFFVLPYLVLSAIFIIIPLCFLFVQMFRASNGSFTTSGFNVLLSASNYKVLFQSLGIALLNTVICLLIAYPLAYILASMRFKRYLMLPVLFIIPMWINFMLRIYALQTVFDIIGLRSGVGAMIIGLAYDFFPFMFMPIYTSLSGMDKSYKEASYDLGAAPVRTFLRVTLPMSIPGMVSGALMVFMPTISAFAVSSMLGGTFMLFGDIVNAYFERISTYNAGAVLAFVMLLLVVASAVAGNLVNKKSKTKDRKSVV